MSRLDSIAIVGGGPAGALAGALLAAQGRLVALFDEKLVWEKPCGGGVTYKALEEYPFLADAGRESNPVEDCELISPSGRRAHFRVQHPVAIFSRLTLNGLLLERARQAGVDVRHERVTCIESLSPDGGNSGNWQLTTPHGEYRAGYLILAAGARNQFRAQFLSPMLSDDLMVTAGYFIPGRSSRMQIQFLQGLTGYIWVFPRTDHFSAGIACKMGETPTAELRRLLERWLQQNGFSVEGAQFYSHILPSFRTQTFAALKACGEGWAMIGDTAGLVDPITGEGLYYALRSAELCAKALLEGRPDTYQGALQEDVIAELKLAASVSERFYQGQIFGESVLERMVLLTAQNAGVRRLMSDLFAGIQGYRDLRSRLYRILPSLMAEGIADSIRKPWTRDNPSRFARDPLAE